jgi:hypothetical protein
VTRRRDSDGKLPPRLLLWLTVIRDHPDRPPPEQRHVLYCLVLRIDWTTGAGSASLVQLAADAGCGRSTVQRALGWAQKHDLLVRTQRGHRRGDGSVWASEWWPHLPSEQFPTDLLTVASTGQNGSLNRSMEPSQQVSGELPSVPRPSVPRPSSARARASAEAAVRAVLPDLTDDETKQITGTIIREHRPRDPGAYIAALAASGDLARYVPCDTAAPGRLSAACRHGDSRACVIDWCECRCHGSTGEPPAVEAPP